jgi:hypothetical protein
MLNMPALICVMSVLSTGSVAAQEPSSSARDHRAFVDGGVLVDVDPNFEGASYGRDVAAGGTFGIGAFVLANTSLRFEMEIPAQHVGIDFGDGRDTARMTSYAFMLGRHSSSKRRVRLGFLVGLAYTNRATSHTGFYTSASGERVPLNYGASEAYPAIVGGVDGQVALTPRIALVPQFRIVTRFSFSLPPYFDIPAPRGGITLRWQF